MQLSDAIPFSDMAYRNNKKQVCVFPLPICFVPVEVTFMFYFQNVGCAEVLYSIGSKKEPGPRIVSA